MTFA
jgi:hypothetical protein